MIAITVLSVKLAVLRYLIYLVTYSIAVGNALELVVVTSSRVSDGANDVAQLGSRCRVCSRCERAKGDCYEACGTHGDGLNMVRNCLRS